MTKSEMSSATSEGLAATLPCPFCGGSALVEHFDSGRWQVSCGAEDCLANITWGSFAREAEAITAWNTRPSQREARAVEVEREVITALINEARGWAVLLATYTVKEGAEAFYGRPLRDLLNDTADALAALRSPDGGSK
jgi:hypothetical protein